MGAYYGGNLLLALFGGPPRGDGPDGTPKKPSGQEQPGTEQQQPPPKVESLTPRRRVDEHRLGAGRCPSPPGGSPKKGLIRNTRIFFPIFSVKNRVLKLRFLAFPEGPGGFRELREAGRNHFHLSWYL